MYTSDNIYLCVHGGSPTSARGKVIFGVCNSVNGVGVRGGGGWLK